jgi:EAL domain-containing protein (putative c-di-GMP-specific phosphodiesterase class I)
MAAHRLPAPAIVLELTEHDLEGVRDGLAHELQQVRAAGVRLAVDDFGTGYSSFSRLSELPLDELKIDHLFTSRMLHDPRSQEVVSAILRLATSLGLDTVAEGVESPEQVAALIDVGCTHGQGYLWSPAVPPEEFVALVEAWRPRVP